MVYELTIQYAAEDPDTAQLLADDIVDKVAIIVGESSFVDALFIPVPEPEDS